MGWIMVWPNKAHVKPILCMMFGFYCVILSLINKFIYYFIFFKRELDGKQSIGLGL